jgi:hypothetical protein
MASKGGRMTLDFANIVGLVGSAVLVIAFAYSNLTKAMNLILFNLLNLAGALALIVSLRVHFNIASMILEIVWAAIALFGMVKALTKRARA